MELFAFWRVVRNSIYFCFFENDDFTKKIISAKMLNGRYFMVITQNIIKKDYLNNDWISSSSILVMK